MKHLFLGLTILCGLLSVEGQVVFKHTATSSNITNNWTTLDNAATNGNSRVILTVTSDYGNSGPYHDKAIGVWYSGGKWHIFNQDRRAMRSGAKFNVLVSNAGSNAFVHTANTASITGRATMINHPALNGNGGARPMITQNYGSSGPYNNKPISTYYFDGRWFIQNLDRSAIPTNAKFNVVVHPETFSIRASSPSGNWYKFRNAATDGNSGAIVFATQSGSAVNNANYTGVWYNRDAWTVYNQNRRAMPSNTAFHILAMSSGGGAPSTGDLVVDRDTWYVPLNEVLRTISIRINNYTPNKHEFNATGERAFLKPDDSYFRMVASGRVIDLPFNIDMVEGGPDNRCKAYLNDWNSSSASSAITGGRLRVLVTFESAFTELVTNCYNNACCEGNPFCPGAGCPDYELNNAIIELFIRPVIRRGRLTYDSEVNFVVQVGELGDDPCTNNFWAFLCDWGLVPRRGDRQNIIRGVVQTEVRRQLESTRVRGIIDAALASAAPSGSFSSVSIDARGNLVFNR